MFTLRWTGAPASPGRLVGIVGACSAERVASPSGAVQPDAHRPPVAGRPLASPGLAAQAAGGTWRGGSAARLRWAKVDEGRIPAEPVASATHG